MVIPINTRLDLGQSLNASLTLVIPADAGHRFLNRRPEREVARLEVVQEFACGP